MRLTAVVTHERDWYVARCVEVDVASQGATADEALLNVSDAVALLIRVAPTYPVEPPIVTAIEVPA